MKYHASPYCFRVWMTSVLVAPIFLLSIEYFVAARKMSIPLSEVTSFISSYLILIFAGAVASVMTFLIFWSIGIIVYRSVTNAMKRKLIMSLTGCVLTALTFLLFFFPDDMFSIFPGAMMSGYCFCIAGSSLIYHFEWNYLQRTILVFGINIATLAIIDIHL